MLSFGLKEVLADMIFFQRAVFATFFCHSIDVSEKDAVAPVSIVTPAALSTIARASALVMLSVGLNFALDLEAIPSSAASSAVLHDQLAGLVAETSVKYHLQE
jgi:hypothetical protein